MLGLDAVIIRREPFKHNSHQAVIIILVILYFACDFLLILYNYVYIVFTAILVGLGEILVRNSFLVMYVSNYLYFSKL